MQELTYRLHDELEDRHWWFVARRRIVLMLLGRELRRNAARSQPLRLLDVGCGTGSILRELARLGEAVGVDGEPAAVEASRRRAGCEVRLGRLPDGLPFEPASFDVVTLLDVLEHVEEDVPALRAIERLLAPGGLLLVTVPAFGFLWSDHDVVYGHWRRYTRRELGARLEDAGLQLRKLSYYNTLLFSPIAALRLLRRLGRPRSGGESAQVIPAELRPDLREVPRPLNALLRCIFGAERQWLRFSGFPFGVSVLALARKPGGPA